MKNFFVFLLLIIFAAAYFGETCVFAQSGAVKKNKIKKFGSSLSRKPAENLKPRRISRSVNEDVITVETNLVVLDCLVVDTKGNIITGLETKDFEITENSEPKEINNLTLGSDAKVPRSIVLVIDYSGSQKPYLERSVEAAKLLVDKLRPNDLMAIVTDDIELIAQFTADKKKLKKELDSLKKNSFWNPKIGESRQFSALYATLNEVFDENDIRPIVIFQTDGDELLFLADQFGHKIYRNNYFPKVNFSTLDLRNLIARSRASIYSIFVGTKLIGLSPADKQKKKEEDLIKWAEYWKVNPKKFGIIKDMKEYEQKPKNFIGRYSR